MTKVFLLKTVMAHGTIYVSELIFIFYSAFLWGGGK